MTDERIRRLQAAAAAGEREALDALFFEDVRSSGDERAVHRYLNALVHHQHLSEWQGRWLSALGLFNAQRSVFVAQGVAPGPSWLAPWGKSQTRKLVDGLDLGMREAFTETYEVLVELALACMELIAYGDDPEAPLFGELPEVAPIHADLLAISQELNTGVLRNLLSMGSSARNSAIVTRAINMVIERHDSPGRNLTKIPYKLRQFASSVLHPQVRMNSLSGFAAGLWVGCVWELPGKLNRVRVFRSVLTRLLRRWGLDPILDLPRGHRPNPPSEEELDKILEDVTDLKRQGVTHGMLAHELRRKHGRGNRLVEAVIRATVPPRWTPLPPVYGPRPEGQGGMIAQNPGEDYRELEQQAAGGNMVAADRLHYLKLRHGLDATSDDYEREAWNLLTAIGQGNPGRTRLPWGNVAHLQDFDQGMIDAHYYHPDDIGRQPYQRMNHRFLLLQYTPITSPRAPAELYVESASTLSLLSDLMRSDSFESNLHPLLTVDLLTMEYLPTRTCQEFMGKLEGQQATHCDPWAVDPHYGGL